MVGEVFATADFTDLIECRLGCNGTLRKLGNLVPFVLADAIAANLPQVVLEINVMPLMLNHYRRQLTIDVLNIAVRHVATHRGDQGGQRGT